MSPETEALVMRVGDRIADLQMSGYSEVCGIAISDLADLLDVAIRGTGAEERARADTITPAMIQAAQDRVQGPDEDMYSAIYRAMRGAAYVSDNQSQEGGSCG